MILTRFFFLHIVIGAAKSTQVISSLNPVSVHRPAKSRRRKLSHSKEWQQHKQMTITILYDVMTYENYIWINLYALKKVTLFSLVSFSASAFHRTKFPAGNFGASLRQTCTFSHITSYLRQDHPFPASLLSLWTSCYVDSYVWEISDMKWDGPASQVTPSSVGPAIVDMSVPVVCDQTTYYLHLQTKAAVRLRNHSSGYIYCISVFESDREGGPMQAKSRKLARQCFY